MRLKIIKAGNKEFTLSEVIKQKPFLSNYEFLKGLEKERSTLEEKSK